MKKSTAHPDQAPEENLVRPADAAPGEMSEAAGKDTQQSARTEPALDSPSAEELADPTLDLRINLAAREQDLSDLSDKYLRLAADYDNFRRRSQKEKETSYADSIALVIKEWLPVLDSLDRAAQMTAGQDGQDAKNLASGIELIQKQALDAMNRLGVSEIDCLNQPFDPNLQEAVMHVEDDHYGASTVVEVFQKGYIRGDRVIRHSLVKVAN
jgi:molecular chaperone GrpE